MASAYNNNNNNNKLFVEHPFRTNRQALSALHRHMHTHVNKEQSLTIIHSQAHEFIYFSNRVYEEFRGWIYIYTVVCVCKHIPATLPHTTYYPTETASVIVQKYFGILEFIQVLQFPEGVCHENKKRMCSFSSSINLCAFRQGEMIHSLSCLQYPF